MTTYWLDEETITFFVKANGRSIFFEGVTNSFNQSNFYS